MTTTIFAVIVAVSNAVVAVFSYFLAKHNDKSSEKIQKQQDIKEAETQLEDACNSGTMSDLLDASKKIGDTKR